MADRPVMNSTSWNLLELCFRSIILRFSDLNPALTNVWTLQDSKKKAISATLIALPVRKKKKNLLTATFKLNGNHTKSDFSKSDQHTRITLAVEELMHGFTLVGQKITQEEETTWLETDRCIFGPMRRCSLCRNFRKEIWQTESNPWTLHWLSLRWENLSLRFQGAADFSWLGSRTMNTKSQHHWSPNIMIRSNC